MLKEHYKNTAKRVKESKAEYILAIQDQTYLNYTSHKAKKEDLGRIGKSGNKVQYGLIQHSTLCVTQKNEALGLIDVSHFHNDEFDTNIPHVQRRINEKETYMRVKSLQNMRERLGETTRPIITVADREGDFYELLHELKEHNEEFVIRAKHDRYTGENYRQRGDKLSTALERTPDNGKIVIKIQDVNTRKIKEVTLNFKAITVTLPVPNKGSKDHAFKVEYKPIQVNVVKAYGQDYEWTLLTTMPIQTEKDIIKVIEIYRARWHIEDFHKVLKTGYQVDEIYLHKNRQTLENMLAMASISACRLYWLIYIGRTDASKPANELFQEFEWKAIYVYFKEPIPDKCPSLSEVLLKIARLGGYKPLTNGNPPGVETMWTGFQYFTIAARIYENMSTKT